MLDIILMAIFMIIAVILSIFAMLVVIGSNINKSDAERKIEDKEQMEFLRKYKNKESYTKAKSSNKLCNKKI